MGVIRHGVANSQLNYLFREYVYFLDNYVTIQLPDNLRNQKTIYSTTHRSGETE